MHPLPPSPSDKDREPGRDGAMCSEHHHRSLVLQQEPKNLFGYRYLYDDWGSINYSDACAPPYYLFESEKRLIEDRSEDLVQHCLAQHSKFH